MILKRFLVLLFGSFCVSKTTVLINVYVVCRHWSRAGLGDEFDTQSHAPKFEASEKIVTTRIQSDSAVFIYLTSPNCYWL